MTYAKSFAVTLLFLGSAFLSHDAAARQDVILPDLAPREVEITGDLTIVFPALRRQPLVGFNPPPPVPDISSSRLPFAEAYKQPSADLPPSPVVPPEPPNVSAIAQRIPMNGKMEASVGRYLDRKLTANLAMGYSIHSGTLLNFSYHGSEGREPFAGSTANSGFDKLAADLTHSRRFRGMEFSVGASGFKQAYQLFGIAPDAGALSLAHPQRDFSGAEGSAAFRTLPGSSFQAELSATSGFSKVNTDVYDPGVKVDPLTSRKENFLSSQALVSIPIPDGYVAITAQGTTSGLDSGSYPGSTVQSGFSQVELSYLYSAKLNLKGGLAVMGFRSEPQQVSDQKRSLAYLSPVLEASYAVSPALRAFAANRPHLTSGLQKNAYSSAPFIQDEALLLPGLVSIDAHTGMEYQSEFVTGKASFGYKDEPYKRFAAMPSTPVHGYSSAYPTFLYEPATTLYGRLDLGFLLSPGMQLGLDAEYRKAELSDSKADIPYFSPLSLGGFVSASFLDGNALVQATFRHESSRPIDLANSFKTKSITLFGVEGSYFLTPTYGVSVGVRNLGASPEFWHMYPFESSTVFMGAKYRW